MSTVSDRFLVCSRARSKLMLATLLVLAAAMISTTSQHQLLRWWGARSTPICRHRRKVVGSVYKWACVERRVEAGWHGHSGYSQGTTAATPGTTSHPSCGMREAQGHNDSSGYQHLQLRPSTLMGAASLDCCSEGQSTSHSDHVQNGPMLNSF